MLKPVFVRAEYRVEPVSNTLKRGKVDDGAVGSSTHMDQRADKTVKEERPAEKEAEKQTFG